jgi:hypothetical protein
VSKAQSEIIGKQLELIKGDIQKELSSLAINFTGQLSDSLTVELTGFGAVLKGLEYLPTSYDGVGRGPGGNPFIDPNGLRAKGIQPRDLKTGRFISFKSAAILVSQKIGREGTDRYTNKRPGVDIDAILEKRKHEMMNKLKKSFVSEFRKDIKETIIR